MNPLFVQVEHDAIKRAQEAAPILGMTIQHFLGGLNLLWARVLREASDLVTPLQLEGVFGSSHSRLAEVLLGFGFLEESDGQFRIRGVDRYEKLAKFPERQSAAGKARAAGAKRGSAGRFTPASVQPESSQSPAADQPRTENRDPITETQKPPPGAAAQVEELRGLWNGIAVPAGCKRWDPDAHGRERAAKARLRDKPDLAYWRGVIERIAQTPFCLGLGPKGWVADADFLVTVDGAVKVLEGKYDDRAPPTAPGKRPKPDPVWNEYGSCAECGNYRAQGHRESCREWPAQTGERRAG